MSDRDLSAAYEPNQERKEAALLRELNELTAHHRDACAEYDRICSAFHPDGEEAGALVDVPLLPVGLFKALELRSVPGEQVHRIMRSSGTTGQRSRIVLDEATADAQADALSKIMSSWLGSKRRPMLIIDSKSILRGRGSDTARAAAVVGMMRFGGAHHFALDDTGEVDIDGLRAWIEKHEGEPLFIFGFTFLIWSKFLPAAKQLGLDLPSSTLFHGGGWKRLEAEAVPPSTFNAKIERACNLSDVRNYYGMIEQVGSIYVESADGVLIPPRYSEVIIRDPVTLEPLEPGEEGIIQVLSTLPRSYPGHSILTEDVGVRVRNPVDRDRLGPWGFRVNGRLPRAEARGCSDVYAA